MSQDRILARASESSAATGAQSRRPLTKATVAADEPPEAVLDEIRGCLRIGDVKAARELAVAAAARHPEHAEIRAAVRVLAEGKSYPASGTGRNLREEYEWLRDPPERYRGKWVALVGTTVLGAADTLKELLASLPSDSGQTPLTVQVEP